MHVLSMLVAFVVGTLGFGGSLNPGMGVFGVKTTFSAARICLDLDIHKCTETNTTEIVDVSLASEHRQSIVETQDFRQRTGSYTRTKLNETTVLRTDVLVTSRFKLSEHCRTFPACRQTISQVMRTIYLDDTREDTQVHHRTLLVCTTRTCTQTTTVSHSSCDPRETCVGNTTFIEDTCRGCRQCYKYTRTFLPIVM